MKRKNRSLSFWKKIVRFYHTNSDIFYVITVACSVFMTTLSSYAIIDDCSVGSGTACVSEFLGSASDDIAATTIMLIIIAIVSGFIFGVIYLAVFDVFKSVTASVLAVNAYDKKANVKLMREAISALEEIKEADLKLLETSELLNLEEILSQIQFPKKDLDYQELKLSREYLLAVLNNLTSS